MGLARIQSAALPLYTTGLTRMAILATLSPFARGTRGGISYDSPLRLASSLVEFLNHPEVATPNGCWKGQIATVG